MKRKALVVGATGLVGSAIVQRLVRDGVFDVICASRRGTVVDPSAAPLAVDLGDAAACRATFADCGDVTHLFFAAYQAQPSRAQEVAPNLALLANSVEALAATGKLQHVTLITGAKFYGIQWGEVPTPMREGDARSLGPNFYYSQEDYLRERSGAWSWTNLIPPFVTGSVIGNPMNLMAAIGVYATLSREAGLPLHFPGSDRAYRAMHQIADADQIAAAAAWAAQTPAAAGEAFNIANGDPFRWERIWPEIAGFFGLAAGEPRMLPLADAMPAQAELWARCVARYGLSDVAIGDVVNWAWADYMFRMGHDVVLETGKIRRAGFHDCISTTEAIKHRFRDLQRKRLLPP